MKGTIGIFDILGVLITVIFFSIIYPTLSSAIAGIAGLDPLTQAILNLVPGFIALSIIIGIVVHALPEKQAPGG